MAIHRESILARYAELLGRIGSSVGDHPVFFTRQDDGMAHLELAADGSATAVITERGLTVGLTRFEDEDALLYHLVRGAIWMMAVEFEKSHRVEGQDVRRVIFARDLELMGEVSPEWAARRKAEIEDMLRRYPYHDSPAPEQPPAAAVLPPSPLKVWVFRTLLAGGFVLLVMALHWPLMSISSLQQRLENDGKRVDARVTDRHIVKNRFADIYQLSYQFQVGNEVVSRNDTVSERIYQRAVIGGSIPVLFDREDPSIAMIRGNDRASRLAWIWGMIDVLILIAAWRIWRSSRQVPATKSAKKC